MDLRHFCSSISIFIIFKWVEATKVDEPMYCIKQTQTRDCAPKARRYDIPDMGHKKYFHGWVDVQGQGAANDYCRIVGMEPNLHLSCALAGTHGQSDKNYNSAITAFPIGYPNTWYMKDEDGDGRDDYCRCVGSDKDGYSIMCTKAGIGGFYGSRVQGGQTYTFPVAKSANCKTRVVRQEFGKEYFEELTE